MAHKKRTFRQELIKLTMTASLCGMLVLGITLILISLYSFSGNASKDMQYFLATINKQFEDRIIHLEDAVTAVRHDTLLNVFFKENGYKEEDAVIRLSYNANLFSEKNKVYDTTPFAVRMYIFNNKGQYVRSYYYPYTESHMEELDSQYQKLWSDFEGQNQEFYYEAEEDVINLCCRLYDDDLEKMGVCIIAVDRTALQHIYSGLEQYDGCIWLVEEENSILASNENGVQAEGFLSSHVASDGIQEIGGRKHMFHIQDCGFGLRSMAAVKNSTIYASITSSVILFLVTLLLLLGVIGIVVFFVAIRFTKPLVTMAHDIGSFGKGELDTRLESFDLLEFDDISVVFNEMAERIHYLITQVYEKQLLATQAQVNYLQSQINPHFMFNILTMISMKAKLAGNEEVYSLLSAFASLLQGKIFRKGSVMIPLAEEMKLVEFYLYLQSTRFKDRITYEIRYEEESLKRILIPRLCIEPLVENAISHGLEPKEDAGKIWVAVRLELDRLCITVEDNGVGFDVEKIPEKDEKGHTHVSLTNTRKLLQILYGDNYEMEIESSVGRGTRITMRLPVQTNDRPDKNN